MKQLLFNFGKSKKSSQLQPGDRVVINMNDKLHRDDQYWGYNVPVKYWNGKRGTVQNILRQQGRNHVMVLVDGERDIYWFYAQDLQCMD